MIENGLRIRIACDLDLEVFGVAKEGIIMHNMEVHGRLEPVVGVLDLFRGLRYPRIIVVRRISSIEIGHELRVDIEDRLKEYPVLKALEARTRMQLVSPGTQWARWSCLWTT